MNRRIPCQYLLVLLSLYGILTVDLNAQEPIVIPRLSEEPEFDGHLFEPVWDQVDALDLIKCIPNSGGPPSLPSSFKIGYTDHYLYVAFFNYDSEPDKIQSSSKIRDEMQLNNDWCGIHLDVYNDKENALSFFTTPASLRLDMQIFNDGQGFSADWNALWEVETEITGEGWFAEFRIPLSTLRYQVTGNKVVMGIAAFRYIARSSEWGSYPEIPDQWGFYSWLKVSRYQEAELHDVKSVNPLYFSPFVLGGYQMASHLNTEGTSYEADHTWKRSAGMDVKYGLAKNLTLDLTVNTDFAQVEADDQQINLTRYSLFFPEKRQFFMERSNIFDFSFGDEGQLFYSRRIGLFQGQQVPIWGGGRITGRAGKWDLGVMSLQTGTLEDDDGVEILGTQNHSVVRVRRQVPLNTNSYVGVMGLSKLGKAGDYYGAAGADAILNLKGNTYMKLAWAQTLDTSDQHPVTFDQGRYEVMLQRRMFDGFFYTLGYERAGGDYNPLMGFEFRNNFTKFSHLLGYGIISPRESWLSNQRFSLAGSYYLRNGEGSVETVSLFPMYYFNTKNSASLTINTPFLYDDVRQGFRLSDEITVGADQYRNLGLTVNYGTSSEKMYRVVFIVNGGTYYGGWRNAFTVTQRLSLGNTWRFFLRYNLNRINFREMDQVYLAHLVRFKLTFMYSTKLSATCYIQYNSLVDQFFINARFRYNPAEGNDLYLVYNDGMNSNRGEYDPVLPLSDQRTILLKYTHTFRIR